MGKQSRRTVFLQQVLAVLVKDLKIDLRRKTEIGSALVFSIASGIATAYITVRLSGVAAFLGELLGMILVMVFLAVFASLASFIRESEQGTLEGLRASPIEPETLFIAKLAYSFMLISLQLTIYIATLVFFAQSIYVARLDILAALFSSALYFAAASSFSSALLVYSEARGVLLPVTTLVLVLPFVQNLSRLVSAASKTAISSTNLLALLLIAVAFISLVTLLSKYIIEAI